MKKSIRRLCGLLVVLFSVILPCEAGDDIAFNYQRIVKSKWLGLATEHFRLVTDLDKSNAQHMLNDLEAFRFFLTEVLSLGPTAPRPALPLLAISEYKNYKNIALHPSIDGVFNYNPLGYSAIATVFGYHPDTIANTEARHVLYHEYMHFLMLTSDQSRVFHYPDWYIEGMAEYWATFLRKGDSVIIGDPGPISDRIFDLVSFNQTTLFDTESLFHQQVPPIDVSTPEGKHHIGQFYARSFFVVHYLNSTAELRSATEKYLVLISTGEAVNIAFQRAFDRTFQRLDRELMDYLVDGGLVARRFSWNNGSITFPTTKPVIKKLSKIEKHSFFPAVFWNASVINATMEQRFDMMKQAINAVPENTSLQRFQDQLNEMTAIGDDEIPTKTEDSSE